MKNVIIIFLITIIFFLLTSILTGKFCNCGSVKCPNYCPDEMRSILT